MAKSKVSFVCQTCGYVAPRWMGKCSECNTWNSFVEEAAAVAESNPKAKGARSYSAPSKSLALQLLHEVSVEEKGRISTHIEEFDRALGGGIMTGSIILVGGDPGIGKSTLMMQMLGNITEKTSLYVTGEESAEQLQERAVRLGIESRSIYVLPETDCDAIIDRARQLQPAIIVVDSIQTLFRSAIDSAPGSVSQVRECTALLMQFSKLSGIPVFVIGHVTKEGSIAGPKVLEHIVDTVLQFEGERTHAYRILRTLKNRYGSTNEIGVFSMNGHGLEQVTNPSEIFLRERQFGSSGSVVAGVLEGTRPVLLEVQALSSHSFYNNPQRVVNGYDAKRVSMLLAVLERRIGMKVSANDVFINFAGGLFVSEPAADLAVMAALGSTLKDIPVSTTTCLIGEVGLSGEVRGVPQIDIRVREAQRLGFEQIILPKSNMKSVESRGIKLCPVDKVEEMLQLVL